MKNLTLLAAMLLFTAISTFGQIHSDTTKSMHKMMKENKSKMHGMDSTMHKMHKDSSKMHHNMKHGKMKMDKNPIIREGMIDLKEIDENKDGKVFQDFMCWNVVSDSAGNCPKCGMKLREASLEKAKVNLVKHGYKVKK